VYRFLLAPRWLALHAALVVVLIAFGMLGWWQLESARSNEVERQHREKGVAVELSSIAQAGRGTSSGLAGQTVTVSGRYDAQQQLLVPGREHDGQVGYYVLTPLRTPEHGVIAVNRGWVPTPEAAGDLGTARADRVEVTGLLQTSESPGARRGRAREAAPLPEGQIGYIATDQLTGRLPYPPSELYDGFVVLRDQQPAVAAGAPVPVPDTAIVRTAGVGSLRNLSYALQWWIFAAAAVFFWASFVRHAVADRRREREAAAAASLSGDPATGDQAVGAAAR
jgi:cytochrome oxidase assembly protein ShyY1